MRLRCLVRPCGWKHYPLQTCYFVGAAPLRLLEDGFLYAYPGGGGITRTRLRDGMTGRTAGQFLIGVN